jgi:hypothetical protein
MTTRLFVLALVGVYFVGCGTPTVVVDDSAPRVHLEAAGSWSTAVPLTVTVDATPPTGRTISAIRLHIRATPTRAVQATASAGKTAEFCLRTAGTTPCPAGAVAVDLPADFAADDAELLLLAEADDNAAARRLGQSGTVRVSVVDTIPPTIELIAQEAGIFPGETLAIRALANDAHSGIARVRWALRVVSNGCVSQTHSGTLEGLLPGSAGDTALITLPMPAGLRSGQVEITELVAIDGAAASNEGTADPGSLCIGSCVDATGPNVSITGVTWLKAGGERVTLNPGDTVQPGADLEVSVRATDAASSVRSLWAQTHAAPPPAGNDEIVCPNGDPQRTATLEVQAPEGVDGEAFSVFAGAYDDFGAGADHNHGAVETPFALQLRDDVEPTITSITMLDGGGQSFLTTPPLGSTVRLRIDANDRFGLIEEITFHLRDQDDQVVGAVAVEPIDPPVQVLDGYVTTARIEMPNPNTLRAHSDWKLVVVAVDNAEPENQGSQQISFRPTDADPPVFTSLNLPATLTLAANRQLVGSISGHDVARYVSRVGLINLQVGATGLSAAPRFTELAANQVAAQNIAVSVAVPATAREGQVTVTPSLTDDSGNFVLGPPAITLLVDDILPVINSATFSAETYQPGQEVQLTIQANDVNSLGIGRVSINGPDQIVWQSTQSPLNPGNAVTFTGVIPEDIQLPENGLQVSTAVTVTDRAQDPNQRSASVSTQILDTGGPLIFITANEGGDAGGTASISVRARDVNGNVKRIELSGNLNRFPSGSQAIADSISWGVGDQADVRTHTFTFNLPIDLSEGLHNLQVTAWDYADNQTPPVSVPVPISDATAPHSLTVSLLDDPVTTGGTVRARVSAADQQSGIDELRLVLSGAAGDQNPAAHPCGGSANCSHIFTLNVPESAPHGGVVTATAHATDAATQTNLSGPATDTATVQDNDAPTGGFTNVGAVQVNTGSSVDLELTLTDVSSGLTRVEFSVPSNCGSVADHIFSPPLIGTTNPPLSISWSVPADCRHVGAVEVTATVHDNSPNSGHLVDTQAVTINDTTPPSIEFRPTTPVTGSTGADLTVSVRIRDRSSGAERVSLSVSPACASVSAPTTETWNGRQTGWLNANFTITGTEDCPPGDITVTLNGRDQAGNDATPITHDITLSDTSGPSPFRFLTGEPFAVTVGQTSSFQLEAQDPSSGLDRISFDVPCGSIPDLDFTAETSVQTPTVNWTVPADCRTLGSQQIVATGHDESGNTSSDTLSLTVSDTTAPVAAWINTPPGTVSIANGVSLTARGTDSASGVQSLTFSVLAENGTFVPTSIDVAGAPTSADRSSTYSAPNDAQHDAAVTVNVTVTDVSNNTSDSAAHTMTFVDDVAPTAITQTNDLAANRALGSERYAVAAGDDVSVTVAAQDPNSGIAHLRLVSFIQGGSTTLATSGDLGGVSPASAVLHYIVPAGLAHGTEITVQATADDVSPSTGYTIGETITLVVDSEAPSVDPVLVTPAVTSPFGTANLRCLLSATPTISGTADADIASLRVKVLSLPALNVVSNETTSVAAGAWSTSLANLVNLNAYRLELSSIDAVGNERAAIAVAVRADLETPPALTPNPISNNPANAGAGHASYQPLLSGLRTAATGAATLTQGRFETCIPDGDYATDVAAGSPNYAFDPVPDPGISFGAADNIDCTWRVRESFCSRITDSTGAVNLSKANAAPTAATQQKAAGQDGSPTLTTLQPELSAQYNDTLQNGVNEVSFARHAEVELYHGATRIWASGEQAFTGESGERFSITPPLWRPHAAAAASTQLTATLDEWLLVASPDSNEDSIGEITQLNRSLNIWGPVSQTFAAGENGADVAMNQAMIGLASNVVLWVLPSGDHYFGTLAGSTITWSEEEKLGGLGGSFSDWESVRLAADPNDANRAMLFAARDNNGTVELETFRVDPPNGGNAKYSITQLSDANDSPPTVGIDFQVTHLTGGREFRLMPGTGTASVIGATLNGTSSDWTTLPVAIGSDRTFGAGAAIGGASATNTYLLVLGGASDTGYYVTAAATANDDDSSVSADLPAGILVGGAGQRIAAATGSYEPLLLAFDAGNTRLRPTSFDDSEGIVAWVSPPDPDADETPMRHGESYTWDIRFTDEADATGSFLGAGARQAFSINW